MASPQKENGYTAIANELMLALAGIRISGEARQCLDVIIQKTYGWNKKEDIISLSQFSLITHLGKDHICRNLNKLANMKLIIAQKGNKNGNKYRFNKDFDTWKPLPKKAIIAQKGKASLPKMANTKTTNTKSNNILKKIMDDITIETDESLTPTGKWKKQEAKKKGYVGDEVIPLVKWAEEKMGRKYPSQLPQRAAVSQMLNSGYSSQEIKDKFEELEEDKFWGEKGVDFKIVLNQIAKTKKVKKLNPLLYAQR